MAGLEPATSLSMLDESSILSLVDHLNYTASANILILVAYQTATDGRRLLDDHLPCILFVPGGCLSAPLLRSGRCTRFRISQLLVPRRFPTVVVYVKYVKVLFSPFTTPAESSAGIHFFHYLQVLHLAVHNQMINGVHGICPSGLVGSSICVLDCDTFPG